MIPEAMLMYYMYEIMFHNVERRSIINTSHSFCSRLYALHSGGWKMYLVIGVDAHPCATICQCRTWMNHFLVTKAFYWLCNSPLVSLHIFTIQKISITVRMLAAIKLRPSVSPTSKKLSPRYPR